jgi:hypothetical protein
MTYFSLDPSFDLTKCAEYICLHIFPYPKIRIRFLEVGKKEGNTMICLGEEPNTYLSDSRESFEELSYVYIFKIK